MNLPTGTLLQGGKYKIVRFISSGGFGCTYEAEHVMLHKRMAIKEFFVKDFCNRDETTAHVIVGTTSKRGLVDKLKKKFIDEAIAISALEHPNIVRVSDVFEENGTAYYVMDFINGMSLAEIVKNEGHLAERRALRYIRQVASALKYVHAQNRLHLDVKPSNIMIDSHDNAILIDFGTSKQYDEENGENTSTLMGKTPGYAPIEQMGNDIVKFTPATDIYALGATLYKAITSVTPMSSTLLAGGEELASLPSTISPNVAEAISLAMKSNKKERPQNISEFLSILDGTPTPTTIGEETILDLTTVKKETEGNESLEQKEDYQENEKDYKRETLGLVGILIVFLGIAVISYCSNHPRSSMGNDDEYSDTVEVVDNTNGYINDHEYVDLGLSVKWATCNVGATSSSDYGNYYAWGETRPKSEYTVENSITYGKNMGSIAGNSTYDVARANWGGTWRLPTKEEIKELDDKCRREWTKEGGHNGYKVIGPNGNSIFLPATGRSYGTSYNYVGEEGSYWGATPKEDDTDSAISFGFDNKCLVRSWDPRCFGYSVRPVTE